MTKAGLSLKKVRRRPQDAGAPRTNLNHPTQNVPFTPTDQLVP